jgi:exosome complex exonuclease RRP6
VKPQLAFDVKPDNNDTTLWKPILDSKPHAILTLEESLVTVVDDFGQTSYEHTISLSPRTFLPPPPTLGGLTKSRRKRLNRNLRKLGEKGITIAKCRTSTDNTFRYKHPYETEILQLKYPDSVYQHSEPILYQPVDTTSATFVDTEEGVLEMLNELKNATEIAIDLEHHDARTYVGLVSLMQISTRGKDWIVDTLKPWRHKLQVLNEVFADPKIVKVFGNDFHSSYTCILIR